MVTEAAVNGFTTTLRFEGFYLSELNEFRQARDYYFKEKAAPRLLQHSMEQGVKTQFMEATREYLSSTGLKGGEESVRMDIHPKMVFLYAPQIGGFKPTLTFRDEGGDTLELDVTAEAQYRIGTFALDALMLVHPRQGSPAIGRRDRRNISIAPANKAAEILHQAEYFTERIKERQGSVEELYDSINQALSVDQRMNTQTSGPIVARFFYIDGLLRAIGHDFNFGG